MCPKRTILVVTCCFNATSNRYPLAVNCGSVNVPGRSSTCSEKVHPVILSGLLQNPPFVHVIVPIESSNYRVCSRSTLHFSWRFPIKRTDFPMKPPHFPYFSWKSPPMVSKHRAMGTQRSPIPKDRSAASRGRWRSSRPGRSAQRRAGHVSWCPPPLDEKTSVSELGRPRGIGWLING